MHTLIQHYNDDTNGKTVSDNHLAMMSVDHLGHPGLTITAPFASRNLEMSPNGFS